MKRRRFLELLAGSAGSGVLGPGTRGRWGDLTRRVRPGDPGWPGDDAWKALGQQLRGALTRVDSPFAAGPVSPELLKQLENPYFVGDQAWATQSSGWAGAWSSKPSAWAVAARTAEDVAAAVGFARKHRVRLVVKGGGHSYQGTSNAPGFAAGVDAADGSGRPAGRVHPAGLCGKVTPVPAVSVGAGALWLHTYDAVTTVEAGTFRAAAAPPSEWRASSRAAASEASPSGTGWRPRACSRRTSSPQTGRFARSTRAPTRTSSGR